jgi:hypothetical protein
MYIYFPKISRVYNLCSSFCLGVEDSALAPFMPRIATDVGPFLLATSEDSLSLVLETISVVLEVEDGNWMTPDLANSLVLAVLEVWAKNNKGNLTSIPLVQRHHMLNIAERSHLPLHPERHLLLPCRCKVCRRLRNRRKASAPYADQRYRLCEAGRIVDPFVCYRARYCPGPRIA